MLRARARGFTLVELMVAMVGAFFVSIAVFSLTKFSSNFYSRESRVADATMQALVGFERLRADIARAGFLGTPNIRRDPRLCGNPSDASWPAWLSRLSSVTIENTDPDELGPLFDENDISPHRLVLSGSYSSADLFEVRTIINADPIQVVLEPNSLGMVNLGFAAAPTSDTLTRVFRPGRALRLMDDTGRIQFAAIQAVAVASGVPVVTLAADPALVFRAGSSQGCGVRDLGGGYTASVVNIIRYDIRNLSADDRFNAMFPAGAGPSYESTRRELIREELDVNGDVMDGTLELVAEYVVDLDFSLVVEQSRTAFLQRITGDDMANYAGDPTALVATGPQQIRAVHAWLSVRSQEADRDVDIPVVTSNAYATRLRVDVGASDTPFARVRTLQSMVNLGNHMNLSWY